MLRIPPKGRDNSRLPAVTATIGEGFLHELERICGSGSIVRERLQLLTYETDALPYVREEPAVVVLPGSADQVQQVVRLCAREGVPFVARGHGTGLSGGAVPVPGGVVIALSRLNRVLDIDIPNRRVTVEPGVYFIPMLLRDLRSGPAASLVDWALVDRLVPCGGIRIEDDVLATPDGHRNLTRPHV